MLLQLIAGGIKYVLCHSTGKLAPGFLWSLPQLPFPFADFAVNPLDLSCESNYMLSPVSPSKSLHLGVFLGTGGERREEEQEEE